MPVALRWLLAHAFVLQLIAYVVRPASSYRAIELGVSPGLVGLIAASFSLVPLVVAVAAGRWNDRGGQTSSLVVGAALMVLATLGLLLAAEGLASLLVWNAVLGLAHLLSLLAEQTQVATLGRGRLDSVFGTFTFAGTVGQAAAPLLLASVGGSAVVPDTRELFAATAIAALSLALLSVPLVRATRHAGAGRAAPAAQPSLRKALAVPPATRRSMGGALLLSTLVLAAVDLVQVYLPALGAERGISSGVVGVLLALRAVATMLSRVRLGRLVERVGRRRLVVASCAVSAVALAAVAVPMPPAALGVAMVVAGLALGVGQPLGMAIVAGVAPSGTLSTWLAVRLTGNRLGQVALPALLGATAAGAGVGAVFALTAASLAGTALACRVLLPPDRGAPQEPDGAW